MGARTAGPLGAGARPSSIAPSPPIASSPTPPARAARPAARASSSRLARPGPGGDARAHRRGATSTVPRERFVLPEDIAASAADAPCAARLRAGLATVSAPHAYVLTYGLLGLAEGDHLLELGIGHRVRRGAREPRRGRRAGASRRSRSTRTCTRGRRASWRSRGPRPGARDPPPRRRRRARAPAAGARCRAGPEPLRVAFTYAIAAAARGAPRGALPRGTGG